MSVTLLCPNLKCRAVLQVPDSVRGQTVRCGHCGTLFAVPARKPAKSQAAPASQRDGATNTG